MGHACGDADLVNAMAANGDDLFDQTENSNVSAVIQYQR